MTGIIEKMVTLIKKLAGFFQRLIFKSLHHDVVEGDVSGQASTKLILKDAQILELVKAKVSQTNS